MEGNIPKTKNRLLAAEIFSSAICPLDCKYCYIPKTDAMKNLQKKIIEKLKNKEFINDLEKFYGDNLQHLAMWGAEPTLTLSYIGDAIPDLVQKFPKLSSFSFSTSLMTNTDIILNFIKTLSAIGRKAEFKCQISLDGPAYITDVNRIAGAAKKAPENFYDITEKLNDINLGQLRINFHTKSTFTMDNIRYLNKNKDKIKEYFDYFEAIYLKQKEINKNKNVTFTPSSIPTLTVPGKYTTEDGKELAIFFKNLRELARENRELHYWTHIRGSLNSYVYRLTRIFKYQNELASKACTFTCSGGDSDFGLGVNNDIRICHRMFFLNNEEYINSILTEENIENWDVSLLNKGNLDLINKNYNMDTGNEKDWPRVLYILRNYHDFVQLRTAYIKAMVTELALCGQSDKIYLRSKSLPILLSAFLNTAMACHTENLLNTGVIYFTPVSIIRLFSNGAFQEILKDFHENV